MSLKNTPDHYGLIARGFHWMIGLIMLGLVLAGFYMVDLAYSPDKIELYGLHKSFGLLVLFLASLRLGWRFLNPPPEELDTHQAWEKTLAKAAHIGLYVCMFGMPLSGWLMSSAGEYPVPFFGIQMPDLSPKNETLYGAMITIHEILAYGLVGLVGMHIAGALKHHVLDRDETLKRMSAHSAGLKFGLIVGGLSALFFTIVGLLIFTGPQQQVQKQQEPTQQRTETTTENVQPTVSTNDLSEWSIIFDQSRLTFQAVLYGKPFEGRFERFDGQILFDRNNLKESHVKISIAMNQVRTGDSEHDSEIVGPDWFASETWPNATFETKTFESIGENQYMARGHLTIRDKTLPVEMPFDLIVINNDGEAKRAIVSGNLALNRLDFGVGQGEWTDTATVDNQVLVKIELIAVESNTGGL